MKKFLAWLLACVMLLSLAACAKTQTPAEEPADAPAQQEPATETPAQDEAAAEEATGWTGDISHIVVTYLTTGVTPPALEEVQDAVNAITTKEIGVEVELRPMSAYDAIAQLSVQVAGGDDLDLVMLLLQSVKTWTDQGLLEPLDDYLAADAPYISEFRKTVDICAGTYTDGKAYGVTPIPQSFGNSAGFVVAKDYLDEIGFEHEVDKVYTLDEVHDVLAAIKEKHPEMYPNGTLAQGTGSMAGMSALTVDLLGANDCSGALIGTDSTEIVNLFATPEYEQYVRTMRQWYEEGLSYPDAAVTSSTVTELVASGTIAGYFMSGHPSVLSDVAGHKMVALRTTEPGIISSGSTGSFWALPITCSDPDAAIRFLDYVCSNHEVSNLLMMGIEGEHYVVADAENNVIGFPEGVDATTSTYYNQLGVWGDRRYEYVWSEAQSQKVLGPYSEIAMQNQTQAVGYAYDATAMATQISVIQSVIAEYCRALEAGSVDVDTVLPEFISRLEAAGINEVIADNQAQFDAWRAAK